MRTIPRSELKNAPYNPRKINDYQRAGLKKNLKRVGLIQPLLWNEATGNLVSGHQRISILDDLERSQDYEITVAVVSLTDKEEREQNVFLNATTFTGEFDLQGLAQMIESQSIDYEAAGLDLYDLNIIGVYGEEEAHEDTGETAEQRKARIKAEKKRAAETIEERWDEGEPYVTLSFSSYEAKAAFVRHWGFDPAETMIKGEVFAKIMDKKTGQNEQSND